MRKSFSEREFQRRFLKISKKEKIVNGVKTFSCMLLVEYCFYQDMRSLPILLLPGILFYQSEAKELLSKKKEELRGQFKELLLFATAAQKAGYAIEKAFVSGYADMSDLYGESSGICFMINELRDGIKNGIRMQDLLKRLGRDTEIEEIVEFSNVFGIAKESGGNMTMIMEYTAENIADRVDTKREIETFLSARKLELNLMNIMPMILIIYLNLTSPGYFKTLYHSVTGMFVMTGCLLVYLGAYLLGKKIIKIGV